jgi:hypothetical protein
MTDRTQTEAERERLLDLGHDGIMMCIDMATEEGRSTFIDLSKLSEDIQKASTLIDKTPDGYLLALHINGWEGMIVKIITRENIKSSIKLFHDQALKFGNVFSFAIIPQDYTIADMIGEFANTEGLA